jgi:hypothetical protein
VSCDHERFNGECTATTIRSEYAAVRVDPDSDSDSDPEAIRGRTTASSRRLKSGAAHATRSVQYFGDPKRGRLQKPNSGHSRRYERSWHRSAGKTQEFRETLFPQWRYLIKRDDAR